MHQMNMLQSERTQKLDKVTLIRLCSWESLYALLNNYFCRTFADFLQIAFLIFAEFLRMEFSIADFLQMEFSIAEFLQICCRFFADFLQIFC